MVQVNYFFGCDYGKGTADSRTSAIQGKNLKKIPEFKIARIGIGRKFQTPRVYLNLTVRENLDLVCNQNKNVFSTCLATQTAMSNVPLLDC